MTTYRDSGVNIDAGNEAVRRMKGFVRSTFNKNVLGDLGSFGGLFHFDKARYKDPILVSSTDGVGTKIMVAAKAGIYHTVGQDLVNHCVNDILVQGALPLFFLDYFSTGKLNPKVTAEVVRGLSIACKQQKTVLIGGETAEMPGLYAPGDFDLAGTIVGVVDRKDLITGDKVKAGDIIIGLPSAGLHTNGYSLARKVLLEGAKLSLKRKHPLLGKTLAEALLAPHRCYAPYMLPLRRHVDVHAMAHLTGGGFTENIPRVLPKGLKAVIQKSSWEVPALFRLIVGLGSVPEADAYRTLNMGIGMVFMVSAKQADKALAQLKKLGMPGRVLGRVEKGLKEAVLV
ncbi:MAG: phosphoribosylformylglycinamidine cyclo-ligase [bacterium]